MLKNKSKLGHNQLIKKINPYNQDLLTTVANIVVPKQNLVTMFKRNVVTGKYNWWLKIYNEQFPNTVVLNRITDDISN